MRHPDLNPAEPSCVCGDGLTADEGTDLSRRGFVASTIIGAAAVMAGATVLHVPPAMAQSTLTPDAALKALMDGNQRFVERRLTSFQEDIDDAEAEYRGEAGAVRLRAACADSRVPVELVFDQSIGHVFVNRVAGNIATSEIIASVEYGAAVLGTSVFMVLGHGNCGAVKATIAAKAVPGQISSLHADPRSRGRGRYRSDAAIDANARNQAKLLSKASVIVSAAIKEGKLKVVPARYDLASGKVSLLT